MKTKENVVVKTLLKSQNPAPITGATRTYFSKGKQFSHRPEQDPFHLFQQHRTSNFTTTMATLLLRTIKTHHYTPLFAFTEACTSASAALFQRQPFVVPARVRSVATTSKALTGFGKMAVDNQQKFYMIGGKGGVGKTSCAASLAVKFASQGHPTIVVSTDPAHSLSDSFSQDLTGGSLVPVEGVDSPLYALELNPEKAREEFRTASQNIGGSGYKNFMDSMGLGVLGNQLEELKLGELLDSPPPGFDEAIAISKVMQILESQESRSFTRIVFDTAPTGHTLRLLSLPDFLDASLGKMMKLKKTIASATSAFKAAFGKQETLLDNPDNLEKLRERMAEVRDLFRNPETTEFVIVTIPTVMAINESSRLLISLRKEGVPVQRLIVNQVLPLSASDCKFCELRRKDQMRAFDFIKNDKELQTLRLIQAPLVDAEIRGVPALKFFGDSIWR